MIKNIILDVGGVIFDDSKEHINKILKKDSSVIYKKAYGGNFKKCMLGELSVEKHINSYKDDVDYKTIKFLLNKNNQKISLPLIKDNWNYIKTLKDKGYNLYLLTNITEDSYNYIRSEIDIDEVFSGGIYSYQEHLIKPNSEIYELLIKKYNLKKEETIFFDDKEKNIIAANNCGIKGVVFKNIYDIKHNLK